MKKTVLDSSAWIEYFRGTERGRKVRSYVTPDNLILLTGAIVSEVLTAFHKAGVPTEDVLGKLQMIGAMVSFDYPLADSTARIYVEQRKTRQKFSLIDAHVLATARMNKATVITCDHDFSGLPDAVVLS